MFISNFTSFFFNKLTQRSACGSVTMSVSISYLFYRMDVRLGLINFTTNYHYSTETSNKNFPHRSFDTAIGYQLQELNKNSMQRASCEVEQAWDGPGNNWAFNFGLLSRNPFNGTGRRQPTHFLPHNLFLVFLFLVALIYRQTSPP